MLLRSLFLLLSMLSRYIHKFSTKNCSLNILMARINPVNYVISFLIESESMLKGCLPLLQMPVSAGRRKPLFGRGRPTEELLWSPGVQTGLSKMVHRSDCLGGCLLRAGGYYTRSHASCWQRPPHRVSTHDW